MSFDNLCKLLSEKHPVTFARWVLGTPQTSVSRFAPSQKSKA